MRPTPREPLDSPRSRCHCCKTPRCTSRCYRPRAANSAEPARPTPASHPEADVAFGSPLKGCLPLAASVTCCGDNESQGDEGL